MPLKVDHVTILVKSIEKACRIIRSCWNELDLKNYVITCGLTVKVSFYSSIKQRME